MTVEISARLLRLNLEELHGARTHLTFSHGRIAGLEAERASWTEEDLERIEAYTSRFARVVDLLTNRVLRALFRHELEPAETMLDRLNLAEKRGFVDEAEELRLLKENRNAIAHDYAGKEIEAVFAFCRDRQGRLDAICDRVAAYSQRLLRGAGF